MKKVEGDPGAGVALMANHCPSQKFHKKKSSLNSEAQAYEIVEMAEGSEAESVSCAA